MSQPLHPRCVLGILLAVSPLASGQFRSIDGSGNNLTHPDWGAADTPLMRETTVMYGDSVSSPAGANRPNARTISVAVCAEASATINSARASSMLWQWGQFLDHDIDLSPEADPAEDFSVLVPMGDRWFDPLHSGLVQIPLHRSAYDMVGGVRQQRNAITAWIDASNVYGSDLVRAMTLLDGDGRLQTSAGDLLPYNTAGLDNAPTAFDPSFFLAGDVRANEQVGLTALHTLFLREHNRLVDLLGQLPVLGADPLLRYQIARAIVGAQMQFITYDEFLPTLLGHGALTPYAGYDADALPSIANVFSTAAYRVGHTMLPDTLLRLDEHLRPHPAGELSLAEAFFVPGEIEQHGIDPILRGLSVQFARAIDTRISDGVRNFLFGPPGAGGLDLAALNIQRGRDHGLPDYNTARADMGLAPVTSFGQITSDQGLASRLRQLYGSVDDIDLWIGGLAEDALPGSMLGPLFHTIVADQFQRLRDGDRFWYQSALPHNLVSWIESRNLADIIRDNTDIGFELADDVFHASAASALLAAR